MNKTPYKRLTDPFERRLDAVRQEIYEALKAKVIEVCDRHNWDMSSLLHTYIWVRGGDKTRDEVDDTRGDAKRLVDLVCWADDLGAWTDFIYEDGKWTP